MQKNRVIYLKKCYHSSAEFKTEFLWKVVEIMSSPDVRTMTLCGDNLTIDLDTNWDDAMAFINEVLCEEEIGEYAEEISREEFDSAFTKVVSKINW